MVELGRFGENGVKITVREPEHVEGHERISG